MKYLVAPCFLLLAVSLAPAQQAQHGLRVPEGFTIAEFAESQQANDIYCMTIDAKGRLLVSGRGYLRSLIDCDDDGKADTVIDFAKEPADGAMGMLWEDGYLYYVGDGGLRRVKEKDCKAAGPSELLRKIATGGEHSAHCIRRGPDGWLYLLCGNNSGVDKSFATTEKSPIRDPVAGTVLRFSPDFKQSEIVADGFRNPYGMDFNGDGELFTYDSDNERCVSLPWYEPTRFYHVIPGGHYGWRSPQRGDWWRLPPYSIDVVPPLVTLERGSPTGVACYRHTQFPEKYREGFFALDWTFGRIWFVSLKREGASYTARRELFLEAVGENGFAPTAAAVDPTTGDLYVSIGGRGTRGAVYRIRYDAGVKDAKPLKAIPGRIFGVTPDGLGIRNLGGESDWVRLRLLQAVYRHPAQSLRWTPTEVITEHWDSNDRMIQQAVVNLVPLLTAKERATLRVKAKTVQATLLLALGCVQAEPELARELALELLSEKRAVPATQLGILRLVQLLLGDLTERASKGTVWEGYTPAKAIDAKTRTAFLDKLREWPTSTPTVEDEALRTLAMLEDDDKDTLQSAVDLLTADAQALEDIHHLIVISRLKAIRDARMTAKIAATLLDLDRKLARANRDTHWPLRMRELHAALAKKDDKLNAALLGHRDFGRPEHVLWTQLDGFPRDKAAARFELTKKDTSYPWNAGLIRLLTTLPKEQSRPVLRKLWGEVGLDEVIVGELAASPDAEDRSRFLEAIGSPQQATVRTGLKALRTLPDKSDAQTLLALVQATRRLGDEKEAKPLLEELTDYLTKLTGEKKGIDRAAWVKWFQTKYPDEGKKLYQSDGVDVAAWTKRLAALDWAQGDVERGRQVHIKASCASCHSGAQALGPDLHGSTGRFSRDDLFTAILQPSKDVSARYRTVILTTKDDKPYQGIIVYEATDSVMLQTGAATTIRLDNKTVTSKRTSLVSLMPTGLLDKLSDKEIIDLYAYLKSLQPRQKRRRRELR